MVVASDLRGVAAKGTRAMGDADHSGGVNKMVTAQRPREPLSKVAQDARRPPAPALLLDALQDRPHIPSSPRIAFVLGLYACVT